MEFDLWSVDQEFPERGITGMAFVRDAFRRLAQGSNALLNYPCGFS